MIFHTLHSYKLIFNKVTKIKACNIMKMSYTCKFNKFIGVISLTQMKGFSLHSPCSLVVMITKSPFAFTLHLENPP